MSAGVFEYQILPSVISDEIKKTAGVTKMPNEEVTRRLKVLSGLANQDSPTFAEFVDRVYRSITHVGTDDLKEPVSDSKKLLAHGITDITPTEHRLFKKAWVEASIQEEAKIKAEIGMYIETNPEELAAGIKEKSGLVKSNIPSAAIESPNWTGAATKTEFARYWNYNEEFTTSKLLKLAKEDPTRLEYINFTFEQLQELRGVSPIMEELYQHYVAVRALGPPAKFEPDTSMRSILFEGASGIDD